MTNTLYVRSIEQAAAFLELDGQLSDGYWKNARPNDHWKPWCNATVVVAEPNAPLGRTFHARKVNYDFTAPSLLMAIGLRMLGIVRIARQIGMKAAEILEFAVDCETGHIDWAASWNKDLFAELEKIGVTPDSVDLALANESYGMSELHRDLNDLKAIIKVQL